MKKGCAQKAFLRGVFHKTGLPAEIIVGRWLAAAVTNDINLTMRREMNPRPTAKASNVMPFSRRKAQGK